MTKRLVFLAIIFLATQTVKAQPPKKAVEAYNQAMQLVSQTKFADALGFFKTATDLYPRYYQAYLQAAITFSKLGVIRDAVFCFNKAIELKPDYCEAYIACGTFYKEARNRSDSSLMYYEKALKHNCASNDTLKFNLGWCYNDKKQYDKAMLYLKQALEHKPDYRNAINEISFSFRKSEKMEEGIAYFQELYDTHKVDLALYYVGMFYIELKQKDKATAVADELKKIQSRLAPSMQKRIDAMQP